MSHITYDNLWKQAQCSLDILQERETAMASMKPVKDKNAVYQLLIKTFVEYVGIYQKMELAYDQVIQPQKRLILRELLENVIGRLIELKHEMVNHDMKVFQFHHDIFSDLKMTPTDFLLHIPNYTTLDRKQEINERNVKLDMLLKKIEMSEIGYTPRKMMSLNDSINILQRHERARQGRLRALFMQQINLEEQRRLDNSKKGPPRYNAEEAAIVIQKFVRGFLMRKRAAKMRHEEDLFIGMTKVTKRNKQVFEEANGGIIKRRQKQKHAEEFYQKGLVDIHQHVRDTEGPEIMEGIQTKIRDWFVKEKETTGAFPDIPDEESGGCRFLFFPEETAEPEKEPEKEVKKEKGKDEGEVEGWKATQSEFTSELYDQNKHLKDTWAGRDEVANWRPYDSDIIRADKRIIVWDEVQVQADEIMRTELSNLIRALEKASGKKGKKGKKDKKKGKGKKDKGKKGKKDKKKGKKDKDLTANRTMDSLWEELVNNKIIIKPDNVGLSDYIGDYNYLANEMQKNQPSRNKNCSYYELVEALNLYGILPLCGERIHELSPHTKSILLVGPSGSGKKMLVHAIANEIGAVLFDISCDNLVGKYPGKKGTEKLMHMVFKVARGCQPSIILMRDAELGFMKKPPKKDPRDPKRLKKDLPKTMKTLCPGERVLVVGCSDEPWLADMKALNGVFQRYIRVPDITYGTRRLLWQNFYEKYSGSQIDETVLSSLTKVSENWTAASIKSVCGKILRKRRTKIITGADLLTAIADYDKVPEDTDEQLDEWQDKTPLGKALQASFSTDDDDGADKKKKK